MNIADDRLDGLVDRLLTVLADEIKNIERTLERLDGLRAAVIKRDEEGLNNLLEEVKDEQSDYALIEQRRDVIRNKMSEAFGCDVGEMNLSKLCSELTGERRDLVSRSQQELKELCAKLQKEHMATDILLKECSRLNNLLLRSILGNGKETMTYNSRGNASWELQKGMVSVRL
ncbi:MAG: flagellar export chaperone FlgN [Planctomycetota bacterium]|jgi:hypothetical protein